MNKMRKAREWATPTLKDSAFLKRGVLTPEEFVKAGDELVYKCPTWTWESGDPSKRKKYLPDDKQVCTCSITNLVGMGWVGGGNLSSFCNLISLFSVIL